MLSRKSLARVSSAPGKTITINFYEIDKKLFFTDLPGYGYAKRTFADKEVWSALTDGYFTNNPNIDLLSLVVQLIDSRCGITKDDEMMLSFLAESGIPFVVVATKCDKLNATERKKNLADLRESEFIPSDVSIIPFSSLKGEGKADLWKEIALHTGVKL